MGGGWLLEQQRLLGVKAFCAAPPINVFGMLDAPCVEEELEHLARRHPEHPRTEGEKTCLVLLPIYQTSTALGALSRCGLFDCEQVKKGFMDLLRIRGPGGGITRTSGARAGAGDGFARTW